MERRTYSFRGRTAAALAAYSSLQSVEGIDASTASAIAEALKNYCELDTFAMVLIWEYFNNECR